MKATTWNRLEETKRIARLLELVRLIAQQPERHRRRDLASRFEVSERMIQKDFDLIRHGLKFPLVRSQSGYYFEELPRLPALHYSLTEGLAMLLAVQAACTVPGIASGELAAAVARLKSLFPPEFLPLLGSITGTPAPTARGTHRQEMLLLLNQALAQRAKVRLTYATRSRGGERSERVVRPYHIKLHVRSWHLIAHCERRQEIRVFKIDRIETATLLDERYSIPEAFDPAAYLGDAWGVMRGDGTAPQEVLLQFEPEAGHWVAEEHWHATQQIEEQPDGSVLFRVRIALTPEFVNWVLYYGSRVRVLEPRALQQRVAEEHRRALALYAGT